MWGIPGVKYTREPGYDHAKTNVAKYGKYGTLLQGWPAENNSGKQLRIPKPLVSAVTTF